MIRCKCKKYIQRSINCNFSIDEIRVVRDGKFGKEVSHRIWSGLVGEILRKVSRVSLLIGNTLVELVFQNIFMKGCFNCHKMKYMS